MEVALQALEEGRGWTRLAPAPGQAAFDLELKVPDVIGSVREWMGMNRLRGIEPGYLRRGIP